MLIKSRSKIDRLTDKVESWDTQRQADEARYKRQEANLKTIKEAQNWCKMDFWCRHHRQDTTGMAYKVTFHSFGELKAYYESCGYGFPKDMMACCKGLKRNITDKQWDDYYKDSEMVRLQARQAQANGDLLQPGDDGFITKYGDPNKKKWEKIEKDNQANWEKKIMV